MSGNSFGSTGIYGFDLLEALGKPGGANKVTFRGNKRKAILATHKFGGPSK